MTVAELVEKLKNCDQNKDVLVEGRSELKDIAREKESSLDEKIKEANQRGISYGELQAEKLIEKSRIIL